MRRWRVCWRIICLIVRLFLVGWILIVNESDWCCKGLNFWLLFLDGWLIILSRVIWRARVKISTFWCSTRRISFLIWVFDWVWKKFCFICLCSDRCCCFLLWCWKWCIKLLLMFCDWVISISIASATTYRWWICKLSNCLLLFCFMIIWCWWCKLLKNIRWRN